MATEELPSMITFSENISDAEAPEPLPVGEYNALIRQAKVHKSNNSGKLMANVSFTISPEDYPADFDPNNAPDGVTLSFYGAPLEQDRQSRYRLKLFLEAIGAPMSKEIDLNDWLNLNARIRVETEEYEGVVRNRIKSVVRA